VEAIFNLKTQKGPQEIPSPKKHEHTNRVRFKFVFWHQNNRPCDSHVPCIPERDSLIRQLKEKESLSIRQIERATGVSRGIIAKKVDR
jgi:putative transposase